MAELSEQIAAFSNMLPQIREDFGSAWVLFANGRPVRGFKDFEQAALYAFKHYGAEQVLIRHTDDQRVTVPFVIAEN
jgi:hypothetical protein